MLLDKLKKFLVRPITRARDIWNCVVNLMKVNPFTPSQMVKNYVQQKKVQENGKSAGISFKDSMEISREAREIQDLKAEMNKVPDVRNEKVARLKEMIDANRYKVDSWELANNIIKELVETEKSRKG